MNMAFYLNFNTGLLIRVSLVRAQVEEPNTKSLTAMWGFFIFSAKHYTMRSLNTVLLYYKNSQMIFDHISNASRYVALHPLFSQVFEFIKNANLSALANGKHAIIGDEVFVIVARANGRTREDVQLECHRKYIDIQLVLSGTDEMGWKPLNGCHQPVDAYNASADIQFFYDAPDAWISTPANTFCLFFPEDAHAPLVSDQMIHKAVFKIAVNASAK